VPNTSYNEYKSGNKLVRKIDRFSMSTGKRLRKLKEINKNKMSNENIDPVNVEAVPTLGEVEHQTTQVVESKPEASEQPPTEPVVIRQVKISIEEPAAHTAEEPTIGEAPASSNYVAAEPTVEPTSEPEVKEEPEVDEYAVDVPDIPMPAEEVEANTVDDTFEGAFKFAVIGIGQGGSRIAQTFWNLGYRRVAVINTAKQDLEPIAVPSENKLLIGGDGAGKQPEVAEEIFKAHREDILDFLKRTFGEEFDRILVCAGAGGGTGAGGTSVVIEVAHDLCESLGVETKGEGESAKVGAIIALPSKAEGARVAKNTKRTMKKVLEFKDLGALTPVVILDNEKIKQIYPKLPVRKFWSTSNNSVCALLHLFNKISAQESVYTSFDKADLETVLSSGLITFGATPLRKWEEPTDISQAIRDNLKRTILADLDPKTGDMAACVVIGSTEVLDELPQENLEHGFEQLTRIMGSGSTVHRGVYSGNKPGIVIYTAIGGLDNPK